jgi:NADP-dependent 3-hydroxy acid dehydrogenase YdfG
MSGTIRVRSKPKQLDALLGEKSRMVPSNVLNMLLGSTQIIGMHCPGSNSIYSSLDIKFIHQHSIPRTTEIHWRAKSFDDRFSRVCLGVSCTEAAGELIAFFRPEPCKQKSYVELKDHLPPSQLPWRALVVGGSRGIGEVFAKLIASRGAEVCITYATGKADATKLVNEIIDGGGRATSLQFDVLKPANALNAIGKWRPSHIFYFASPPIFVAQRGDFSDEIFDNFSDFYIKGLARLYFAVRKSNKDDLVIYYPSSVVLNSMQTNMGEYAAAKAGGESLCNYLVMSDSRLSLRVTRLPRLATDQTATIWPTKDDDIAQVATREIVALAHATRKEAK